MTSFTSTCWWKKKITETEKTTTALAFLLIMLILNCDLEKIFPQVSEMAEEGYPTHWQITDLVPVIFTDPSADLLKRHNKRCILLSTSQTYRHECYQVQLQCIHSSNKSSGSCTLTHIYFISSPWRLAGFPGELSQQLPTLHNAETLVMNSVCVVPWIHLSWLN